MKKLFFFRILPESGKNPFSFFMVGEGGKCRISKICRNEDGMLTEKEGNADWSGAGWRSGQFFLFRTGHIGKTGVYLPFRDAGGGRFAKAKRKVRTPQGRESSIKRGCHGPYSMRRKAQQKTNRRSNPARVKRRGKSPPRFQEIEPAVQAPPGARPNRE